MARKFVLVDGTLHTAISILYALWALWAFTSGIVTLTSVDAVVGDTARGIWTTALGCSCAVAAFFVNQHDRHRRGEIYASIIMSGLILIYPATLIFLTLNGDWSKASSIIFALSVLVIPLYRVRSLTKELQQQRIENEK